MENIKSIIEYYDRNLKWWQRLYLKFYRYFYPIYSSLHYRENFKTGLYFAYYLEKLKRKAKTDEERQLYELLQKEWGEFCTGLTLGYWNKM